MTTPNNLYKKNLSAIRTLEDLQAEIRRVKLSVQQEELELSERIKRMPLETVKAGVGFVIPFAINNKLALKGWSILRDGLGLLFGKGGKAQVKEHLFKSVKQLGFFTALRGVYNFWRK